MRHLAAWPLAVVAATWLGVACEGRTVGPPLPSTGTETGSGNGGGGGNGGSVGVAGDGGSAGIGAAGGAAVGGAAGAAQGDSGGETRDSGREDAGQSPPDAALRDDGGQPRCDAPACIPSLVVQLGTSPGATGRVSYIDGTVLDGATIYGVAQVIAPPGTALSPVAEVSAVDVTNGSKRVISGPDEFFFVGDNTAVAVDATDVYWFSRTRGANDLLVLRKANRVSGAMESVTSVSAPWGTQRVAFGLAADATDLYWGLSKDGLYRCPKSGCTSPQLVKALMDRTPALGVIGSYVYWGSLDQAGVWRRGLSGMVQGIEERVSPGPQAGPFPVCGSYQEGADFFWAQCDGAHEVHVVDTTKPSDTRLSFVPEDQATTSVPHGSVVADAASVYFLGSNYVYKVPRSGGNWQAIGVVHLTVSNQPVELNHLIGVDATWVYLCDTTQAAIFKLRK